MLLALVVKRVEATRGWVHDAASLILDEMTTCPFTLREEHGTRPDEVAGQRAMMDLAGGPAPMREDRKPMPAERQKATPA